MKSTFTLLFCLAILTIPMCVAAQDRPVQPTLTGTGVFIGETRPLRDIPAISPEEYQIMKDKADKKLLNRKLRVRSYPFSETALPKGPDAVWQKSMGNKGVSKAPIVNFSGQTSPYYPPDCNGAVGPNHYMQTVNTSYAIYNKTGTLVAGPTGMNLLFGSVTGSGCNDGDPLILYDEQASRWLAVEFSICGSNDYMLIAVSTTPDPTGTWYSYSFDVADMPDYEKFGIWQDGYYMGDNNSTGNDIYVFQRSVMLAGGTNPGMVAFNNPNRPTSIDGFMCVPPVDNDGTFAPTGAPGTFIAFNDDAIGGGSDQLWIYELAVNWVTPLSSTFSRVQQLAVSAFDSNFGNDWYNISQPGTSNQVDAIPMVIMNVPQYRNFGTYQTIVCCHTVDVDGTDHAGVRWYELRRGTQTSGNWTVRQQGTYAPDANSRWMGSISLNGSGKIGLGYSISSSSVYPGIRYAGQSASAYGAGNGTLDIPEAVIQTGSYSQTGANRWGDYSAICIDPTDDQTFWYTTHYVGSGDSHPSKIASFKFGNDPTVTTLPASAITTTSATLNGTVNPNGLATNYYFQYGTSISYGQVTATLSAGSGTSNVSVNANITGLTPGTPVHFRLVATNSDGTTNGSDRVFNPGAAEVSTTAASSITGNSASSGGNVTTDGGSTVTARGVCWAATVNPVATGNHTTDGSGLGTFTSSITGLSPSSTYHVRAYATNVNGTFYGNDLTFTTLCGAINSFPWNEGFENGGSIPNCWTQEQVASSGLNWSFITGNGSSNPSTAHGGTYNACLKDNSSTDNKTRLISPPIDLTGLSAPQLKFWHTQQFWSPDQDILTVFYRTSATGAWTQLAIYTTSIATWTQETINLPNASSEYYINFEGNAKYGYGVCVDDVSITGIVTPTLSVTPSNQNVTPPAGSTAFTVTSNSTWSAVSNQTWCTVTPSGTGNGTITSTYSENNTASQRIANVTVTVTGLSPIVVTVTQAAPTLSVTPPNQDVTSTAGNTEFTVTSNKAWIAGSDQTWCTVTPSGTGDGTITATFTENTTTSPRIAIITVTVQGLSPAAVTVTQQGMPASEFLMTIQNITQTSAVRMEFDIILQDMDATEEFELATTQSGIYINPGISSGTLTASIIGSSSALLPAQQPTIITYDAENDVIKLNGRVPPGYGYGTIISTTGTRVCRIRVTSSVPFASSSTPDLEFYSSGVLAPLYATRVAMYDYTNAYYDETDPDNPFWNPPPLNSSLVVTPGFNANVTENPLLNPPPTLVVTPENQVVTYQAGTTFYNVTSNAGWSAISNQTWCSVTGSGFGNGILTAAFSENSTNLSRDAIITVSVAGLPVEEVTLTQEGNPGKVLNLTLLLEGLYGANGIMNPAMNATGVQWGTDIADLITVEFHDQNNYGNIVFSVSNVNLYTNGTASIAFPAVYNESYFVTIRHRNSIETVTAEPILFNTPNIDYNFNLPVKAFGNNLKQTYDGWYVIYGGDVNQDGSVDTGDFTPVDNDQLNFATGYLLTDINGDGSVDTGDFSIIDNNQLNFVTAQFP